MYYSARGGYGPEAIPGKYTIEMNINEDTYSSPFTVKIDPRWDIPQSELIKQFEVANEVIDMIEESQDKLKEMRGISNQIQNFIKLTDGKEYHDEIKKNGDEILGKIRSIEENLYQDKIETSQDEINYARKWTNHITHLYDRITTDNQEPNDGMIDRVEELRLDYERFIKPYNDIINMDLKNFTKMLNEKGVKGIIID